MKTRTITILLLLFCLANLHSQERYLPPQDLKQETFLTEPSTLRKGYFRMESYYMFSNGNTSYNNEGEINRMPEIWSMFSQEFNVGLVYGVTDRFQIKATIPYRYDVDETAFKARRVATNETFTLNPKHVTSGLGDLYLESAYQLFPNAEQNFSFTAILGGYLPTGRKNPENGIDYLHYSPPPGYGKYELFLGIKFRHIIFPFNYEVKANFSKYYGIEKMVLDDRYSVYTGKTKVEKENDFYHTAVSLGYMINDWMGINNDFDFMFFKGMNLSELTSKTEFNYGLSYGLNVYFQLKRFRLSEKFGTPLFGKNFISSKVFLLRLQYTL